MSKFNESGYISLDVSCHRSARPKPPIPVQKQSGVVRAHPILAMPATGKIIPNKGVVSRFINREFCGRVIVYILERDIAQK